MPKKHMRLPNGFGQISKITGRKLRNPYRAMVTLGFTLEGKPKRLTVGYYQTYNEAYIGLVEYHKNPYDPEKDITVEELYKCWSEQHYKKIKSGSSKVYIGAWKRCSSIAHLKVKDIKTVNIKDLLETDMPPTAQTTIKNLLGLMWDYAIEYDIVEKNYPRIATVEKISMDVTHHIPYTEDELNKLWFLLPHEPIVIFVLIQCYTGFRPGELLSIQCKNIHTDGWYIVGGMKTDAGRDRIVPIHERIRMLVTGQMSGELLFDWDYTDVRNGLQELVQKYNFNPDHRPHDGRATFITRMKNAGADEYAIKRIVGHAISDITESTYTTRSLKWLHEEISKLD